LVRHLAEWREESSKSGDDFIFRSVRRNGAKPTDARHVLKKAIRPALERAGIQEKVIGWRNFRQSSAGRRKKLKMLFNE